MRLIENVIKFKAKFIPVLNEQSAGFYAHGYYMATKKTAGLIFTTGPGLTNGLSGIASCYYDRVPLVVLVGQVVRKLNIAKSTKNPNGWFSGSSTSRFMQTNIRSLF